MNPSNVSPEQPEIVVIGGGPSGLSAALHCAENGFGCTLIDEAPTVGGAVFQRPGRLSETAAKKIDRRARELFTGLDRHCDRIRLVSGAEVVGFDREKKQILFLRERKLSSKGFDRLIISAGCYERPQPFPGWTLPGSMTVGGAQLQVKKGRILPGRKIVVVGTGPLLLIAARQFYQAGMQVQGVFEAGRRGNLIKNLPRLRPGLLTLPDSRLWNEYVQRYHYLGHNTPPWRTNALPHLLRHAADRAARVRRRCLAERPSATAISVGATISASEISH